MRTPCTLAPSLVRSCHLTDHSYANNKKRKTEKKNFVLIQSSFLSNCSNTCCCTDRTYKNACYCKLYYLYLTGGYSIPMFVLTTEFSGVRHRGTAGSVVWIGYEIAAMILAGVAYLIRDWRELTIVSSIPGVFYVAGWL